MYEKLYSHRGLYSVKDVVGYVHTGLWMGNKSL